jgi:putative MATE family efflux protein
MPAQGRDPVFLSGSTMRHVAIMTVAAAIGLMAMFLVDAISLFYISQLNDAAMTAAVGRASYIIGFIIGISVGFMVGTSALVARAIGAREEQRAQELSTIALIIAALGGTVLAIIAFAVIEPVLALLEAEGEALNHARLYLYIILPSTPFFVVGVASIGLIRARGDARRSMMITLVGGVATALLDPLFIFTFGLEVTGAAIVQLIVRISVAGLGLYYVIGVHGLFRIPDMSAVSGHLKALAKQTVPTVLTNLATPVGAILIAQAVANYGDSAIAGQAVVDRLIPVAFGVVFALSGAVGPVIGQNFGAGQMDRVRRTLIDGVIFALGYVSLVWALLFVFQDGLVALYNAEGDMALMIRLFCTIIAASFIFNGLIFVTNAAFNNLGWPLMATAFNWSRQTIGVLPFITVGAAWGGLEGIAWGVTAGSVLFGVTAVATAFWLVARLTRAQEAAAPATA